MFKRAVLRTEFFFLLYTGKDGQKISARNVDKKPPINRLYFGICFVSIY